jgi:hypothetical protein
MPVFPEQCLHLQATHSTMNIKSHEKNPSVEVTKLSRIRHLGLIGASSSKHSPWRACRFDAEDNADPERDSSVISG